MMSTTAAQVAEDPAEEQRRMLRESALAFAANELKPARMRTLRLQPVQFDRKLWKTMAEMGWTGLMLPEAHGGSALGIDIPAVVAQVKHAYENPRHRGGMWSAAQENAMPKLSLLNKLLLFKIKALVIATGIIFTVGCASLFDRVAIELCAMHEVNMLQFA